MFQVESRSMIFELPTEDLYDFPGHPYHLRDGPELQALRNSIRKNGVLSPVLVRTSTQGYEMISGHRRVHICRELGLKTVPAVVCSIPWEEAAIRVVDSNLHRSNLLPSEKAFAYRLKMNALRHQGQRTDLTSDQLDRKLESAEVIAKQQGESPSQVRRYVRLTMLNGDLLQMVDDKVIPFTTAVNLSYLADDQQRWVLEAMLSYDRIPTREQSALLKMQAQAGELTKEFVLDLLGQENADKEETLSIPMAELRPYFPTDYTKDQIREEILRLCKERCDESRSVRLI